jgi:hypothetical protein
MWVFWEREDGDGYSVGFPVQNELRAVTSFGTRDEARQECHYLNGGELRAGDSSFVGPAGVGPSGAVEPPA